VGALVLRAAILVQGEIEQHAKAVVGDPVVGVGNSLDEPPERDPEFDISESRPEGLPSVSRQSITKESSNERLPESKPCEMGV